MEIKIIEGNLNNNLHKKNFIRLLNEYIQDKMGGGELHDDEKSIKIINDLINFPTFMVFFAAADEEYAGMANCFVGYSTFNAMPIINIHDIIVSHRYRNMGFGRKILEHIIEKGKKDGFFKITLEVRTDNENAKHLYSKLGFIESEPPMLFWHKKLV
jgi:ribosomal protein S18 acetylase RimI-like enzyme